LKALNGINLVESPSPHFRPGRRAKIDTIVVHYISAVNITPADPFNLTQILDLLSKPIEYTAADGRRTSVRVSAHYLITRQGEIHKLVHEQDVAWHAGISSLRGRHVDNSCNEFSIGIELMGGKNFAYTDEEYGALIELIRDIRSRHNIVRENIVGHDFIAPGRKEDPGPHFDWNRVLVGI
jgi:AmpD protein